jgi:hypothetical protein
MENYKMGDDIWGQMFFKSACNTLKASRWQLWMARLFGIKHERSDGNHTAVGYYHKGQFYLWDYN